MRKFRSHVALLVVSLLASLVPALAPALAKERQSPADAKVSFQRPEEILKWINDYRLKKNPHQLPSAVRAMAELGIFRDLDQAGVYIGFVAGVLGSNPVMAERLIARMFPMSPEDQVALIRAIAYSGLPEWKTVLSAFAERMPARRVLIDKYLYGDGKTLAELPLDEGSYVLDAHWGYYYASGTDAPVRRIISALAWSTDRDNVEKLTIGSMAKWTLATNASRDKDLLDIMKRASASQPEAVQKPLKEVIEAAETFETGKIRKDALAAIEELKSKGPESSRKLSWWGTAGQTVLAVGCVAASALGQVQVGIPCVVGGALSGAALKYFSASP